MRTVSNCKVIAFFSILTALITLSSSCGRKALLREQDVSEMDVTSGKSLLSIHVESHGININTKSVITTSGFESDIKNVLILVVGSDGQWKRTYSHDGTTGLKELLILADGVTSYDIYAFVNMGDVSLPVDAGGLVHPGAFSYTLPDNFKSLGASGIPMCGLYELSASAINPGGNTPVTIRLRRLLSKVNVTVNKSSMLGGAPDGSALAGGRLKVSQVTKVLHPFAEEAERRAQGLSEMYSADTDWHDFTVAGGGTNVVDSGVTLYIPENRQGIGTGTTQADKKPASGREGLATYLEYTATKNGSSDGVSGPLTYRAYLGENETDDFNVIGDKVYDATLSLSWNGLFYEGDWRVTSDELSDTRTLVISAAANSATAMVSSNTKAGSQKVRKATPTAFYMNFFPGGTSGAVAHSRKDMSTWPYGWVAYVDGSSMQMTGTSGTIKNAGSQDLIAWSYDSATDCLSMEAIAGAPASADIHTLQFKTVDGRKASNVVYFTTSIPFEFRWKDGGKPDHVAQRGILEALDADTHAVDPEGIFHLKSGYSSKVRMSDNGDGTAVVELIDGFTAIEDAICIKDSDEDRECKVPLEARVPWFECTDLWTTYVDALQNLKFTYYAVDENGHATTTPMTLSSTVGNGNYLDDALVLECIPPTYTSENDKLGFTHSVVNGTMLVNTYIKTYNGLSPSGNSFKVDEARIGMKKSSQEMHKTEFWAWNPWKNISRTENGEIMNDFTLYKVPAQSSPYTGWYTYTSSSPAYLTAYRPVESSNYTMSLQNAVVANPANLTFDMEFKDITGKPRLGNICSGNPGKTAADYNASAYSLFLDIPDQNGYDRQRIYEYLYARGFQFVNVDDMNSQIAQYGYTFVIGSAYATADDAWHDAPSGVSASTPSSIQGTKFRVVANSTFSTWTMTYGMMGKNERDIKNHGAGELSIYMQVHNAYDSSYLEKQVGRAWMRLHAYIWGEVNDYNQNTFGINVMWLTGGDPNMNALPAVLRVKTYMGAHANSAGTDGGANMNSASSQTQNWSCPSWSSYTIWDTPWLSRQSMEKFVDFIRNCQQPWNFDVSNISDANMGYKYYIASEGGLSQSVLYYDPTATGSGGTFTRESDVAPYDTRFTQKLYVFHIGQVDYTTMNWSGSYNLGFYFRSGFR